MLKVLPLYLVFFIILSVSFYYGITDKEFLFITNARTAVIVILAAGMLMCTLSVGVFITRAPAHPLSILGYLFGTLALFAGIVQIFRLKVPYLSDPHFALIVITASIIIKIVIGRFQYLLPAAK